MKVNVIGLGKLGAPLVAVLADAGHLVYAHDVDPGAFDRMGDIPEPGLDALLGANEDNIRQGLGQADATLIIVPTPSLPDGKFSNEHVLAAVRGIGALLRWDDRYHVVSIVSTVMPGSCDTEIRAALEEASGRDDIGLTYTPEFIALGSVIRDMRNPDFVLIGESDRRAGAVIEEVLRTILDNDPPVHRMSLTEAEITKLMNNAFICTKISFANMTAEICEKFDADPHKVTGAMGDDRRVGKHGLRPGLGYGGPCLPRDTKAVSQLDGLATDFFNGVEMINRWQTDRFGHDVGRVGPIAVLGQSYKVGTPVTEASQAVEIAEWLRNGGFEVRTYDPMAPCSAASMAEAVEGAACVVIATPWPEFRDLKTDVPVIDPWGLLRE